MPTFATALGLTALLAAPAHPSNETEEWKRGAPELKSAGALAFGPDGVLFIADPQAAAIVAVRTGDSKGSKDQIAVDGIDGKLAALLGTSPNEIAINDLAVNPASGKAYLSVTRGRGASAHPVVIRADASGQLEALALEGVEFLDVALPNAPDGEGRGGRTESITDIAFIEDQVVIAGLSNEEFASKLRSIAFPFDDVNPGTSIEIYHGAHGAYETRAPVRTFTSMIIDEEPHLLAAYTCTPLVKLPLRELDSEKKVRGVTIAELGNRNRPLDMVVYRKDGKDYVLISNSSRGMMKVTTDEIGSIEGITEHVTGGGTAGLNYETIDYLEGVVQMDRLDDEYIVALIQVPDGGGQNLVTVETP